VTFSPNQGLQWVPLKEEHHTIWIPEAELDCAMTTYAEIMRTFSSTTPPPPRAVIPTFTASVGAAGAGAGTGAGAGDSSDDESLLSLQRNRKKKAVQSPLTAPGES
jgi:hypothetical protein